MRLYASALARLNGGKTAVQSYILNNRLVQRKNLLGDPLDCLHHAFPGQANLNPSRDFFDHVTVVSERYILLYVPCTEVFRLRLVHVERSSLLTPILTGHQQRVTCDILCFPNKCGRGRYLS